ncbi:hypothetical protein ACIA03_17520 [Nocardioides sp. NPDC051685]|uniref:hypothetical protein n=1 Tax=Nocardioides sp. NPDC051685 TaxID=3364334 RepID=UPI003788E800
MIELEFGDRQYFSVDARYADLRRLRRTRCKSADSSSRREAWRGARHVPVEGSSGRTTPWTCPVVWELTAFGEGGGTLTGAWRLPGLDEHWLRSRLGDQDLDGEFEIAWSMVEDLRDRFALDLGDASGDEFFIAARAR